MRAASQRDLCWGRVWVATSLRMDCSHSLIAMTFHRNSWLSFLLSTACLFGSSSLGARLPFSFALGWQAGGALFLRPWGLNCSSCQRMAEPHPLWCSRVNNTLKPLQVIFFESACRSSLLWFWGPYSCCHFLYFVLCSFLFIFFCSFFRLTSFNGKAFSSPFSFLQQDHSFLWVVGSHCLRKNKKR